MKFEDYLTIRDWTKRLKLSLGFDPSDQDNFWRGQLRAAADLKSSPCMNQVLLEAAWEKQHRPYYDLYPAIAPMLLRVSLEVDTKFLELAIPKFAAFAIRLPEGNSPIRFTSGDKEWQIKCLLAGRCILRTKDKMHKGLSIWADTGERDEHGIPLHCYINLPLAEGLDLEHSFSTLPYDATAFIGLQIPGDVRMACVKLVCAICLLADDQSLIEPEVLSKDLGRYEQTHDQALVDKARRRGKLGWSIGKGIEVIPHIRRPHMALFWTGKGRLIPRIGWRKGSVVHRDTVLKVPSGFRGELAPQE